MHTHETDPCSLVDVSHDCSNQASFYVAASRATLLALEDCSRLVPAQPQGVESRRVCFLCLPAALRAPSPSTVPWSVQSCPLPQPTWTVADVAVPVPADGHFNPEVVKYRQLCFRSQYKRYLSSQQQYFHRLLKQILASRSVSVPRPGSCADTHLVTLSGGAGQQGKTTRKEAACPPLTRPSAPFLLQLRFQMCPDFRDVRTEGKKDTS